MTKPKKTHLQQIIQCFRAEYDLTQTKLADALAEASGNTLTKSSISYWETGITRPNPILLLRISRRCADWRRDFAINCLAAMEPEIYEPAGAIGQEILGTVTTPPIVSTE